MRVFTIGFTKRNAEQFFTTLQSSGASKLIDVRLNNISQLAGFTKKEDLKYFTKAVCGLEYRHMPELAPTKDMLDEYKKSGAPWSVYEQKFLDLMAARKIEDIDKGLIDGACLLCSENKPHHCHRRLVADYLRDKWGDFDIVHL